MVLTSHTVQREVTLVRSRDLVDSADKNLILVPGNRVALLSKARRG